jgi:hypothetical protein
MRYFQAVKAGLHAIPEEAANMRRPFYLVVFPQHIIEKYNLKVGQFALPMNIVPETLGAFDHAGD